ncbi:MAG TPA: NAD-dependent epimerase/dehydratase family protein [Puia sp.]|jgi:dihydroflavonol-4-reductase|nr:NAD-dependent epimerase/dehydratase family protein [Puia sp.]
MNWVEKQEKDITLTAPKADRLRTFTFVTTFTNQQVTLSTKFLVTGGTGFLGAYIIKELVEKNYAVRAIRRSNKLPRFIPESIFQKVQWVEGDVLDVIALKDAMDGIESVIHAAAKVSFVPHERKEMFQTNIEGTANVVNLAIEKDIRHFMHVSSVASLGRTKSGETVNEQQPWEEHKLNTSYAISKYSGEMEVWRAMGEGLHAAIVNPSTIVGYGDWNSSSCAIFKSVYEEFPWYTNGINGFVDVQDAARAIVALSETQITGERFILSGENCSFQKLFGLIADGFKKRHPPREATPVLAEIAWRLEKIKSWFTSKQSLLTKESAKIAQSKTYFDNSKIKKQLQGFDFTPLEQTIQQACANYLKNLPSS